MEVINMDYFVKAEDLEELENRESFPLIMTTRGVQELLGIGKNTIYQLLGSKKLVGFRVGRDWRVTRESLLNYINKH
jgi:excisionase family DNA binding protein